MKNIGDKRVGYKTAIFISFNYLFKSLSNQFLNLSNLWEYFTVQWLVGLHIGLNWNVSISPLFKTEIETLRSLTNIPSLMKFWFGLSQKVWPHLSKIQFPVQNIIWQFLPTLVWVLGWSQLLIFTIWLFCKLLMSQPFWEIILTQPSHPLGSSPQNKIW